jgi:hypothetical protein
VASSPHSLDTPDTARDREGWDQPSRPWAAVGALW